MTINLDSINDSSRPEIKKEIFHQAITPSLDKRIRRVKSLLEAEFRKKQFSESAVKALDALVTAWENKLNIK